MTEQKLTTTAGKGPLGGRKVQMLAIGVLALVLATIPQTLQPIYVILVTNALVIALLGLSFNLLYGYIGLFSFGQAAFFGIGAYGTGLMLNNTDLNFVVVLLAVTAVCAAVGLVAGAALVGLDRVPFIMLTFAFAELLMFAARRMVDVTRGDSGMLVEVPDNLNIVSSTASVYYVVLMVALVTLFITWTILRSRFGLTVRGIRQNSARMETIGVNVWWQRLLMFVIAAGVAGVAGSLSALASQLVYPTSFGWLASANALIVTLIGGSGYFLGPVVGSALLSLMGLYVGRYTTNVVAVNGIVLLLVILLQPTGVCARIGQVWRFLTQWRRRTDPPAPLSDSEVAVVEAPAIEMVDERVAPQTEKGRR